MTPQEWQMELETEAFSNIQTVSMQEGDIPAEPHTHPEHTVHIILKGQLEIIDAEGVSTIYKIGDRVDFPAGTTHVAKVGEQGLKMMIGTKK